MNAEMRGHLDRLVERNLAAGMPPDEARHAALRAFGGMAQFAEQARDERGSPWFEQIWQDMRYAVRSMKKAPSFTFTAVLTLALGIGVNAALFSVVNMVALRPLPVEDPDSLVTLVGRDAKGGMRRGFSYLEYQDYRDGNRSLDGLLAIALARWSFDGKPTAQSGSESAAPVAAMVPVQLVSENYFSGLGGGLQLGRTFRPEEARLGALPVMVLSNLFWESRLHRDPNVVGSTLIFNRRMVTVIGVASPEFSGHDAVPPAGWLPLSAWSSNLSDYGPKGPAEFGVIGRLKPGVAEAQAKSDLSVIAVRRAAEFPDDAAKMAIQLERGLYFIKLTGSAESTRFVGLVLFGFGLVLVIACTNVANLLLARGIARQQEIGVRLMLGAGRGRIVRQLLAENVLLCVFGAILGLGLSTWTLQMLLPVVMGRLPSDWALETRHVPFFSVLPDARVLGFTALLTLGATLAAGLFPAWSASGTNPLASSRGQGAVFAGRLSLSRIRKLLVIVQVAISLTLLSCAGLLARNLFARQNADIGYNAAGVFGVALMPNPAIADQSAAVRQALETVRAIPGVAASTMASPAPLRGIMQTRIRPPGYASGKPDLKVLGSFITDGFFDTFEIKLLQGRVFRESELHSASRVIVISETLARELWPGQNAIGQTLDISEDRWSTRERPAPADTFRACEVIGVVRDIMMEAIQDDRRVAYLPMPLNVLAGGPVYVRPRQASAATMAEITREAKARGIELMFEQRHSFWVDFLLLPFHALAVVSAALGILALVMASVGLYGLMTFSVNQRIREIGIRMALGATGANVVGLFVRQGMRLVAFGLALGLGGGALFALALSKILYGFIEGFDPGAFFVVGLLFTALALLACWLPARRAVKVDPLRALRAE